jgi:hypothetical protein
VSDTNLKLNVNDIELDTLRELPADLALLFEQDDATGQILNARENAETPADLLMQELEIEQQPRGYVGAAMDIVDTASDIGADVVGGLVEAPRQAVAGFLDATAEAAEVLESVFGQLPTAGEDYEPLKIETQPRTVTGQGVRSVSQFLTGFIPALRGAKALGVGGKITQAATAGAVADAAVFDAHEERLSDMVQQVPALQNPLTEYLASDPTDSEAEGRFKNAVEGLFIGGAVDGLLKGVKLIKSHRAAKAAAEAEGKTVAETIEADGQLAKTVEEEQEFISFQEAAAEKSVEIEVPEFKAGRKGAKKEAAKNINLSRIETTDDIKELIDAVGEADAVNINAARREEIANVDLPRLADDLNMTVDELMARRQGEAFNAEQILASRKILVASGENLVRLGKEARGGDEQALAIFKRAMSQHQAIQQQVAGMTAEAGRALQSFNVIAASSREQERLIKEALEAAGGADQVKATADMISQLDDVSKLNKFVDEAGKATNFDMFYTVWINALLSSPPTHIVNIVSNAATAILSVGERKVASLLGESIPPGESTAQLKGMVEGAKDGVRLAWHTFKTNEPFDVMDKLEVIERKPISAKNLELSGNAGRYADFVGNLVTSPGRLLSTADTFFKSVGYRMELHAQAYRTAFGEGLEGKALQERVAGIIHSPPENIKLAAVDASRYQTFTNALDDTKIGTVGELGKFGESLRRGKKIGPYARVIIPFVRTPTNIASYALERTPLAFASRSVREDIAAGGARRDLALGKIAVGSTIMAISSDMAMQGQITGNGPVNPQMKSTLRMSGWQPYSIKVGDTYYAYNRLDPLGALLGIAADTTEIIGQVDEAEADELGVALVLSVVQNMASKTYMSGLFEAINAISESSVDPEADNYKLARYFQRLGGSLVPSGIAAIERQVDPTVRAANGYLETIKARIPGYSDDLPPRRNIFGQPIVLQGGIGPDIMSPVYTSKVVKDSVIDEIVMQEVPLSMPKRVINDNELSPQQYDRLILLTSGQDLRAFRNVDLKSRFSQVFSTSGYNRLSADQKQERIKEVLRDYKEAAKDQLMQEYPELQLKKGEGISFGNVSP